ncbi:MAG TPA: zf-TFIIB domain-containing protein, partial [Micromonosporaceae bacterium]
GAMRLAERNGVEIDRCLECRGVYLDRGELERIIDAEASAALRMTSGYPTSYEVDLGDDSQLLSPRDRRRHPKRRRGIFDDLFD